MEPKKTTRRFRIPKGRTLVLPVALTEGTHNTRVCAGEIVELEVARIANHRRYVNNLVRWGDLVEVTADAIPATPATKEG